MRYFTALICLMFIPFSLTYAQNVRISYPNGTCKVSIDNGKTWRIEKSKTIIFHYPYGVKKISTDNGKNWKETSPQKFTIKYPDLVKTSFDKGKNWVIEQTDLKSCAELEVFPNPASDVTFVNINAEIQLDEPPILYSISGGIINIPSGSAYDGNGSYKLNTSVLTNGYYILQFQSANGPVNGKVLVKH